MTKPPKVKMERFYSPEDCRRKANQHYEMAGSAREDSDRKDERRHLEKAKLWDQRAKEGGYREKL